MPLESPWEQQDLSHREDKIRRAAPPGDGHSVTATASSPRWLSTWRPRGGPRKSTGHLQFPPLDKEPVRMTSEVPRTRQEAVQGRCRYPPPGSRARRLPRRDSSGRSSGGGSWAESTFRPPISGRSQRTPERLRRRLGRTASPRNAAAYARLCRRFPGMNRLRKRPAYAGALRRLDMGWKNRSIFPPEPPLPLHCTQDSRDSHRLPDSINDDCPHHSRDRPRRRTGDLEFPHWQVCRLPLFSRLLQRPAPFPQQMR
jgi:hypothetical protein